MRSPAGNRVIQLAGMVLLFLPLGGGGQPPRSPQTPPAVAKPDKNTVALIEAIEANDVAKVKAAIATGANVNVRDASLSTPLMQACAAAGSEVVTALLAAGAEIGATDKDGFTPLIVTSYAGKVPIARLLLEKGAKVNEPDTKGRTPLMGAAYSGQEGIVTLLLEKGADVQAKDAEDFTALMVAAGAANTANVRLLLEKGAVVDAPTKTGFTPLMQACGAKFDTPFRAKEQTAIVNLLLEHRADVNAIAQKGSTPLMVAAYAGNTDAVGILLNKGAAVELVDSVGHTALIGAAYSGSVESVKMLLDRGSRLETKTRTGFTALMQAAYSGRLPAARLLLARGADVFATTGQGITPLMQAAGTGNDAMLRLLLEYGSDIGATDVKGQNAAYWAIKRGHAELLPLLVRAGVDVTGLKEVPADITRQAAKVTPVPVSARLREQIGSLPVQSPIPVLYGPTVVGVSSGRPLLHRIGASGAGKLAFKAAPLPPGLTLDAATGILSGKIAVPGKYPISLTVTGPAGKATGKLTVICAKDGIARTPPMGWSAWNLYGETVTGDAVRRQAEWLIKTGLAAHGYTYVLLDDTWQGRRDTVTGELTSNRRLGDIASLAAYLHARGLKFGLYSSPNEETCAGFSGSMDHEEQDARTFAKWGADYLKYDWCDAKSRRGTTTSVMLKEAFGKMKAALDRTDRDIFFAINPYGYAVASQWGQEVGANSWWTVSQLNETWESVSRSGFDVAFKDSDAGPGHWNDLGWLYIGKVGSATINPHFTKLTADEQKAQFSLWCLQAAPLILSCDLTNLNPNTFYPVTSAILTNDEVIAIDQDALGKPATPVDGTNNEIWSRPLADGTVAVGCFNRRGVARTMTVRLEALELTGAQPVRDLWQRKNLGAKSGEWSVTVPAHGVSLFKVGKPKE